MKKYIGFISIAAAILSMAACSKEANIQPVDPELVNTPLYVSADINDAVDSKTTLVDGSKVYWETGDTFIGFHKYGNNQTEVLQFTLKNGAGTKSATFESQVPHHVVAAGDVLYGIYGCSLNEAGTLPVWPEEQFASTTGTPLTDITVRNISRVPMFSMAEATSEDTFPAASFKNAGGLVQINVHNNTEANINPDKLRIDAQVPVSGEFNLPVFDAEGNPSFTFTANAKNHFVWTFNDPGRVVNSKSTVPLNVVMPAGTYSGLKFTYTGGFGDIPYGFIRTMKSGASVTVHRSKIDQISMDLYKEQPITPDSPVGTIGGFTDLQDPHHKGSRTGMIVGFDFSTGEPKSKLVICTANMVLNGKTEVDGQEAAWNKGSLVRYNETNGHTSGGHWRLMTVTEARAVMATDEHGTGQAQWGTLNGVEGIYWYFDPERYGTYGANVIPNSIFLPVTHNNISNSSANGRAEGRYWLDGNYYFEFWQDPSDPKKGKVNVIYDKDLSTSDHLGAIRLVHDSVYAAVSPQ